MKPEPVSGTLGSSGLILLGNLRGCTRCSPVKPLTIRVDPDDQVIAHGPCLAQLVGVAIVHHVIAAKRRAGSARAHSLPRG